MDTVKPISLTAVLFPASKKAGRVSQHSGLKDNQQNILVLRISDEQSWTKQSLQAEGGRVLVRTHLWSVPRMALSVQESQQKNNTDRGRGSGAQCTHTG